MRKIIVSNMVSLDGYISGPNGEIDWFVWDRELERHTRDLLETIDTILFGRVTYEMMASYWPNDTENDLYVRERMNSLTKIVFSRTLIRAGWKNASLARDIDPSKITRMKRMAGKNIVVLGSRSIVSALANLGLVDEYRILVNPVLIGKGVSMFSGLERRQDLKLMRTLQLGSGVAILTYQAQGEKAENV